MIEHIFDIVASALSDSGQVLGLTYNEANIILYYLLIPLSWTVMLDILLRRPVSTPALLVVWLGIWFAVREDFSGWCDRAFRASVDFLNLFNAWGGNYVLNSVIICVLIPIIVYGALTWLLIRRRQ